MAVASPRGGRKRTRTYSQEFRERSTSHNQLIISYIAAADSNDVAALTEIVEEELLGVNSQNSKGISALHRAAARGNSEALVFLLESGADVDLADKWGDTALHKAARNGHRVVVEALLAAGANPGAKNSDDATPFMMSSEDGDFASWFRDTLSTYVNQRDSFANYDFEPLRVAKPRLVTVVAWALVKYDFEAEGFRELTVLKGDVVAVLDENPPYEGWWVCRLGTERGLVPNSYVEHISESEAKRRLAHSSEDTRLSQSVLDGPATSTANGSAAAPRSAALGGFRDDTLRGRSGSGVIKLAPPPSASDPRRARIKNRGARHSGLPGVGDVGIRAAPDRPTSMGPAVGDDPTLRSRRAVAAHPNRGSKRMALGNPGALEALVQDALAGNSPFGGDGAPFGDAGGGENKRGGVLDLEGFDFSNAGGDGGAGGAARSSSTNDLFDAFSSPARSRAGTGNSTPTSSGGNLLADLDPLSPSQGTAPGGTSNNPFF